MEGPNPHTQQDDGQQEAEWEYCIYSQYCLGAQEAQEVVMCVCDAVCLLAKLLQCLLHFHSVLKSFQINANML